jgi:hypothetical protein
MDVKPSDFREPKSPQEMPGPKRAQVEQRIEPAEKADTRRPKASPPEPVRLIGQGLHLAEGIRERQEEDSERRKQQLSRLRRVKHKGESFGSRRHVVRGG